MIGASKLAQQPVSLGRNDRLPEASRRLLQNEFVHQRDECSLDVIGDFDGSTLTSHANGSLDELNLKIVVRRETARPREKKVPQGAAAVIAERFCRRHNSSSYIDQAEAIKAHSRQGPFSLLTMLISVRSYEGMSTPKPTPAPEPTIKDGSTP